ncbi:MAG: hypothetical protein VX494_00420 [Actinomycetota bacterium]|nr:hypothetical protein [Actinomycetota bacterium]
MDTSTLRSGLKAHPLLAAAAGLVCFALVVVLVLTLTGRLGGGTERRDRTADAAVAAADAEHVARALEEYRETHGTYPKSLLDPEMSALVHGGGSDAGGSEADPTTSLVWSWANKQRTRFRFCIGYHSTHAAFDSRRGTVTSSTKPRCPRAPVGARFELSMIWSRWN